MFGLLNLNKPVGLSSATVLGRIKHLVKPAKIGHAGTLDPIAGGVLIACLGPATRLVEYIQRMPKRYRGTFLLGRSSSSDDIELEPVELAGAPIPTRSDIERAAAAMVGEIQQRPPAYSALKIAGRPAYELARKGRDVELQPRPVTIHSMCVVNYEYPQLVLDVACGSGTYVRAIGRDLAESLGTAAVMSALERTAIGPFSVDAACEPRELTSENLSQRLLSPRLALPDHPVAQLSPAEVNAVINGLPVALGDESCMDGELAAVDEEGALVSILCRRHDAWWPMLNFRRAD